MSITRRTVLAGLASSAGFPTIAFGQTAAAEADGFVTLRAKAVELQLLAAGAAKTSAWRFTQNDSVVDVLTARQGEELRLRLFNDLDVEIWLHWFGVRGPDGVMTINIPPHTEQGVECVFTPPDAGTFWFGPVLDASRQRDMGLYGMLIVLGPGDDRFHDLPLIIDDWKVDDGGQIIQGFGDMQAAIGEGRLGNWFTANARYTPDFKAPAEKILRLRILNAANVRSMSLQFKGPTPWLAALDGQPVAVAPLGPQSFELAPGQRADLLLDPSREELTIGLDLFEDLVELCHIIRAGEPTVDVVTPSISLPANPVSRQFDAANARVVEVVLQGGAKGGLETALLNGEQADLRKLVSQGKAWAVNGVVGPVGASIGEFKLGETVILAIDNRTSFPQPLHIHGHVWSEFAEDGKPPPESQPVRDTVVVPAKAIQKMALITDNSGVWVLQSLVAERCDSGLLSGFKVG